MLKLKNSRGIYKLYLNRNRIFVMVVVTILATAIGVWELERTRALEGEEWTVTDENGLSITIEEVSQYGVSLVPQYSQYIYNYETGSFGNYYFPTANNGDMVEVAVRVNGMTEGNSYMIFDGRTITSADNGKVLRGEVRQSVYMQDSYERKGGTTWYSPQANEYRAEVALRNNNGSGYVSKTLITRPATVGCQNIEIVSVKQGEQDLYLDTEGWHVSSWEEMATTLQTINEYQLVDYKTPVTVTYKLKNLEIGRNYSANFGSSDYYSFTADTTERTETRNLALNYTSRHANAVISLYGSDSYGYGDTASLYFRVTDEGFRPLGDIVIAEISQGGEPIEPQVDESGYQREYTFQANDVQPLMINLHSTSATNDLTYYIVYHMSGMGRYPSSETPLVVTGEELESGAAVLTIPSAYGLSEGSPFWLYLSVSTIGPNAYTSSPTLIYKNYGENYSGDAIKISYFEDKTLPRYTASLSYASAGAPEIDGDLIDAKYHDATHPLKVRVEGEKYESGRTYNVRATVGVSGGEQFYNETFTATGAELNSGKEFTLSGMTLSLPEFDPSGNTTGYELSYNFSLDIDGLTQSGSMYYAYSGSIGSLLTYDGGEVPAIGEGGGMGGAMYISSSGIVVNRSSLDASHGAVIHYLGSDFDENLSYDYDIYYNDSTVGTWWNTPAGTKIRSGTMTGKQLNDDELAVPVAVPGETSNGVMYTVVISRGGGIVSATQEHISFSEDPRLETFKFTAENDAYMQTGGQAYRMAENTNATATLTGVGFENAEEYKLWVRYDGYHYEETEYGYSYSRHIDLSQLDNSVTVTGAQLNAGYDYTLAYSEAFAGLDFIDVSFDVTEKNGTKPERYEGLGGEMSLMNADKTQRFPGHYISITYVNADEVFRENGFRIDETGEIVDVSQPGSDEPEEVPVDIKTPGDVDVIVNGTAVTVVTRKPTLVIGLKNGHYELVATTQSVDNDGEKTNSYDISGYEEIKVVLKGDGTMDGKISIADSNAINKSLVSPSLERVYKPLTDLQKVILDLSGDGQISIADSNAINKSLVSPSLTRVYRAISW